MFIVIALIVINMGGGVHDRLVKIGGNATMITIALVMVVSVRGRLLLIVALMEVVG